jgi:hypothetical protein
MNPRNFFAELKRHNVHKLAVALAPQLRGARTTLELDVGRWIFLRCNGVTIQRINQAEPYALS